MTAARFFCTYCDHRYLPRAIAMFESLRRHCPSPRLWILCLDTDCHEILRKLDIPGVVPIPLSEFEDGDVALARAKADRSVVEYYFTCTPSLLAYVLKRNPEIGLITYLDSDLYFFNEIEPLFEELGPAAIGIVEHRYSRANRELEIYGRFNVGWVSIRNNRDGLGCLDWWRERCLEWCYDRLEGDRFADQKYLDRWPALFPNLKIIEHKGANVAAWNLGRYRLRDRDGTLYVDEQPLLFFHFHGLRKVTPHIIDPTLRSYGVRLSFTVEWKLFRPYLRHLGRIGRDLARGANLPSAVAGLGRKPPRAGQWPDWVRGPLGVIARFYLLSREDV